MSTTITRWFCMLNYDIFNIDTTKSFFDAAPASATPPSKPSTGGGLKIRPIANLMAPVEIKKEVVDAEPTSTPRTNRSG